MTRLRYAVGADVLRRIDASLDASDIGATPTGGLNANEVFPFSVETMNAHIESVEDDFERVATRLTDDTIENELHEGIKRDFGWTIYLDNENIKPLDANAGDKVEVRSGTDQDDWRDVTDAAFLDSDLGVIEVNRRAFIQLNVFAPSDTNYKFRVTYRTGADAEEGGETTLTASIAQGDSVPITADVSDASQIESGKTHLLGGEEYVFVSSVDEGADQITISDRALRGTEAVAHSSGDSISFIPMNVRDAIAAKVATRFLRQDDFSDYLNEGSGDFISNETKIEQLNEEYDEVVSRYQSNYGYV